MFFTGLPGLAFTLKNYFSDRRGSSRQQKPRDDSNEENLLDSEQGALADRGSLVIKIDRDNEDREGSSQDESEHSDDEESKKKRGSGFMFNQYRKRSGSSSTPPASPSDKKLHLFNTESESEKDLTQSPTRE